MPPPAVAYVFERSTLMLGRCACVGTARLLPLTPTPPPLPAWGRRDEFGEGVSAARESSPPLPAV